MMLKANRSTPQASGSQVWEGLRAPATGALEWVVLWALTPADGSTHVRMEQSGFTPDQKAAYHGANYGWQKFFANLDRILQEAK